MPDLSEERENVIWDTRKAVEVLLKEKLQYRKHDELKSYVKAGDDATDTAREIPDDKIASSWAILFPGPGPRTRFQSSLVKD